jgi:hypothetical protein
MVVETTGIIIDRQKDYSLLAKINKKSSIAHYSDCYSSSDMFQGSSSEFLIK